MIKIVSPIFSHLRTLCKLNRASIMSCFKIKGPWLVTHKPGPLPILSKMLPPKNMTKQKRSRPFFPHSSKAMKCTPQGIRLLLPSWEMYRSPLQQNRAEGDKLQSITGWQDLSLCPNSKCHSNYSSDLKHPPPWMTSNHVGSNLWL